MIIINFLMTQLNFNVNELIMILNIN